MKPTDSLSAKMSEKTDKQLLAMVAAPEDWTEEALSLARAELRRRGVEPEDKANAEALPHLNDRLPPEADTDSPANASAKGREQIRQFLADDVDTMALRSTFTRFAHLQEYLKQAFPILLERKRRRARASRGFISQVHLTTRQ